MGKDVSTRGLFSVSFNTANLPRLQAKALSTGLLGLLLLPLLNAKAARPDASPHLTFTGSAVRFLPVLNQLI
jgi:hypothetical protein